MIRNLTKWFEFKSQADVAELFFYGDIVSDSWGKWADEDKHPQEVADALKEAAGKPLVIYINSGGGSAFAGHAIYNIISRYNGKKTVKVDGLAASAASVIAMAGDEIYIPKNAFLMIHKPWTLTWGNADEMRKMADDLDVIEKGMICCYEKKLAKGVSIETIKELVAEETWMTGEEAALYFDVIVGEELPVAACISECFSEYIRVPEVFKQKAEEQDTVPKAGQKPDEQAKGNDINKLQLCDELELVSSFVLTQKTEVGKSE